MGEYMAQRVLPSPQDEAVDRASKNGRVPKKTAAPKNGKRSAAKSKDYFASIYPGEEHPVDPKFASLILDLQRILGYQLWFIIQQGSTHGKEYTSLDHHTFKGFQRSRNEFFQNKPIGLLVETPGGESKFAYRIARLLQRR